MEIMSIKPATNKNRDGFVVTWRTSALFNSGARARAVSGTAARFPSTVMNLEAVAVRNRFDRIEVDVFVPTGGFNGAGSGTAVQWIRDRFPDDILDF